MESFCLSLIKTGGRRQELLSDYRRAQAGQRGSVEPEQESLYAMQTNLHVLHGSANLVGPLQWLQSIPFGVVGRKQKDFSVKFECHFQYWNLDIRFLGEQQIEAFQ